jgi:hypothetical protein
MIVIRRKKEPRKTKGPLKTKWLGYMGGKKMSSFIIVDVRETRESYGKYGNSNLIPAHKVAINLAHIVTIKPLGDQVKIKLIDGEIIADGAFEKFMEKLEIILARV